MGKESAVARTWVAIPVAVSMAPCTLAATSEEDVLAACAGAASRSALTPASSLLGIATRRVACACRLELEATTSGAETSTRILTPAMGTRVSTPAILPRNCTGAPLIASARTGCSPPSAAAGQWCLSSCPAAGGHAAGLSQRQTLHKKMTRSCSGLRQTFAG